MAERILKAEVAPVKLGHLEFEGLLREDEVSLIALTQLVALGLVPPNRSARQIEALLGLDCLAFSKLSTDLNSKPVNAISISTFQDLLLSLANNGNSCAQKFLDAASISYVTPNKKNRNNTISKDREKEIQIQLASALNGQREVKTLAGRIDILTSTEVIEVKAVSQWKSAIGQIVVYGDYYPSHTKRIHLFGETQNSYLAMVIGHCDKRKILVTWEA